MTHDRAGAKATAEAEAREAATEAGAPPPRAPEFEHPGAVLGPYVLQRVLGEGSFGVVWLAERRGAIVQRVAVKIIKAGMDSRQVIARFDQERRSLAMMEHPYVARVLDAGTAPSGRPYFVMEYVVGDPITVFCDQRRLTVRERLALFARVCEAVQHAHHKGVIHRDLKPANILVTEVDGVVTPKVIDFGIAKALAPSDHGATSITEAGQVIGTLDYMSPEQAAVSPDIDTRADVYALGVLLYELLVGVLPFERSSKRAAAFGPARKGAGRLDPPRLSTRLSGADQQTAEALAARRRGTPQELKGLLRGELDWITLRALKWDRSERYATPTDLANDVRRYLEGKAVEAAPDSRLYRARKFARRNRGGVIAACAVVAALVAGLVGTGVSLSMALEQKGLAQAEAARARRLADARSRADEYLREVFRLATPRELGREATPEEVLDKAASLLPTHDADPLFLGAARFAIASSFYENGMPERALEFCLRARDDLGRGGPDARDLLRDADSLRATILVELRRFDEAKALFEGLRGDDAGLAPSVDTEQAIKLDRNLAIIERRTGDPQRAYTAYLTLLGRASGTLGSNNELTIAIQGDLVSLLIDLGKPDEAVLIARDALRRSGGPRADLSPIQRIRLLYNAAQAARTTGDAALAAEWHSEAFDLARHALGLDHPRAALVTANAAISLMEAGQHARAVEILDECIGAVEQMHGDEQPSLVRLLATRATVAAEEGGGLTRALDDLARARGLVERFGEERIGAPGMRVLRDAESAVERRRGDAAPE